LFQEFVFLSLFLYCEFDLRLFVLFLCCSFCFAQSEVPEIIDHILKAKESQMSHSHHADVHHHEGTLHSHDGGATYHRHDGTVHSHDGGATYHHH
jgi:hypothetical protein